MSKIIVSFTLFSAYVSLGNVNYCYKADEIMQPASIASLTGEIAQHARLSFPTRPVKLR